MTSYANWFSYTAEDFLSQNREIEQAVEQTCRLYEFFTNIRMDWRKFAYSWPYSWMVDGSNHTINHNQEHGCRFGQEQGLDVEDMRVHTLERMRQIFVMVLLAAQFVFVISTRLPPKAVLWLRQLGGKLNNPCDQDGPYWLLQGLSAVITTCMFLSFACLHPFPFKEFTCG